MRLVLILSAFAVVTSPFDSAQGKQLTDGDAIRDRLDLYLIAYEPQLSGLVADERMTQRDGISPLALGQSHGPTKNREIISEVAFIALPGEAGWLGFRRVTMVNGKKIADAGPSLALVLSDGAKDDYDQARLLLARSAEHNLGFPAPPTSRTCRSSSCIRATGTGCIIASTGWRTSAASTPRAWCSRNTRRRR